MSRDQIRECKRRLPLPDLLEKYGFSTPRNSEDFFIVCPFQKEKTASFHVFRKGEFWKFKCFSSGLGGDEITFIEQIDGRDQKDAIRHYKELAGVKNEARPESAPRSKIVRTYDYLDDDGVLRHQTVRMEPKDFRQRRPAREGEEIKGATGKPVKARRDSDGRWWIWSLEGTDQVLYRQPELRRADLDQPVFLVEGEKDVESLEEIGILATTNAGGASKWESKFTEVLANRDVIILFDNDAAGVKRVGILARKLYGRVRSLGMVDLKTKWPECPPKADISDWIQEQAKAGDHSEDWKQTILDWAEEASLPGWALYGSCVRLGKSGGVKVDQLSLAEILVREKQLRYAQQRFWRYVNGVWHGVDMEAAREYVADAAKQVGLLREAVSDRFYASVVKVMAVESARGMASVVWNDHDSEVINVRNGMLNTRTGRVTGHRMDYFSNNQLPVEYHPDAGCPQWLAWLEERQPDEEIRKQLQEILGYLCVPGNPFHAFFVFFGEGGTGKSTFVEVARMLLGPENCTALPLHDLKDGHARECLVGRLLYDAGELASNSFDHLDLIKSIAAGEEIQINPKNRQVFAYRPQGKIVGTSNVFLKTPDGSRGFWRRFIQVPFEVTVPAGAVKTSKHLDFLGEREGIFAWAMEGFRRLAERGHFSRTQAGQKLDANMALHVNSLPTFLEAVMEDGEADEWVKADDIFSAYADWCDFESVHQYFKDNAHLMRGVFKYKPDWKERKKHRRQGDSTIRVIYGVRERQAWRDVYYDAVEPQCREAREYC